MRPEKDAGGPENVTVDLSAPEDPVSTDQQEPSALDELISSRMRLESEKRTKHAPTDASPATGALVSAVENDGHDAQSVHDELQKDIGKLRTALRDAKTNQEEEAVKSAVKQALATWNEVKRLENDSMKTDDGRGDIETIRKEFEKYGKEKERELAEAKSKARLEMDHKQANSMARVIEENKELRVKVDKLETNNRRRDEREKSQLHSVVSENEKLKNEIRDLKNAESVRNRPGRSVIPSERVLKSMSSKALRALRIKIEQIEKEVQENWF